MAGYAASHHTLRRGLGLALLPFFLSLSLPRQKIREGRRRYPLMCVPNLPFPAPNEGPRLEKTHPSASKALNYRRRRKLEEARRNRHFDESPPDCMRKVEHPPADPASVVVAWPWPPFFSFFFFPFRPSIDGGVISLTTHRGATRTTSSCCGEVACVILVSHCVPRISFLRQRGK